MANPMLVCAFSAYRSNLLFGSRQWPYILSGSAHTRDTSLSQEREPVSTLLKTLCPLWREIVSTLLYFIGSTLCLLKHFYLIGCQPGKLLISLDSCSNKKHHRLFLGLIISWTSNEENATLSDQGLKIAIKFWKNILRNADHSRGAV
jgi:hypothetical protein